MTGAEVLVPLAISAAAAAGGTAYSAVQQNDAAEYNAKVAQRQATWEQMRAKAQADRQAERDQRLLATQRAHIAATGLDPSDATPLQLLTETAAQANVDYRNILLGGEMKANSLRTQADMYRTQGQNALISGALGATSSLAGGAEKYGDYQTKMDALNRLGKYPESQLSNDALNSDPTLSYTNGRGRQAPGYGSAWSWMGGY